MQSEDFSDLYELEDTMWWFVGMREITRSLLDPVLCETAPLEILDAGCGTGANLKFLQRYSNGGKVVGIDVSRHALEFCRLSNNDKLVEASAADLPFASSLFDLVTSFDVVVQIPGAESDKQAFRETMRILRPGGIFFIRAAAFEWMRAGHDAAMQTQRRYTLAELKQKLEAQGFEVVKATYANSGLFSVAMLKRLVLEPLRLSKTGSDVRPFPPGIKWLDPLFRRVLLAEAQVLRRTRLTFPIGLSAICVARKPW